MIKIVLPSSDVIAAINEAKEDHMFVSGFFEKYEVKLNRMSIEIEPREGFQYDPTDIFHLGWALREYM
ncbi:MULTISPECIES: hypothetical protein [Sphingobacterium]|uniref:hypothetical protein n=1 Tax=Sphingobacterium TaxID=28453 RepID=UPI00257F3D11|nr:MULTISPECIES: hypothetical protein [Sphingobacterium]